MYFFAATCIILEEVMSVSLSLSDSHRIVLANTHYYGKPTEPLFLNRTLQFHDFIYLINGSWTVTEGNTDYLLQEDDVLLLKAGHHHYTRLPCAPGTRTFCIHITETAGDRDSNPDALTLPACIHASGNPEIQNLFRKIVTCFWSDLPHKEKKLTAYFDLLLLELGEAATVRPARPEKLARRVIRYLDAAPHQNFRCEEAADHFGVSTSELNHAMCAETGLSFSKFQTDRKLEMAARQIEVEPGLKLAEIAANFGFCDEFHLSRSFKRKFGVPPSQYRQEKSPVQHRNGTETSIDTPVK